MSPHGYSNLRQGRESISGQIYHIISRTHLRKPVFLNWNFASAACASFTSKNTLQHSNLLCWVLMPDHAHWLVELGEGEDLPDLVKRMKSLSARAVINLSRSQGRVWYPGFYDRAIRREEDLATVARYIVANPLRAGLVRKLGDYPYWDAIYL